MGVTGADLNFFIPSPPGWIPPAEEERLVSSLAHLAPQWLKDLPDDNWQKTRPKALLGATFKEIDRIESQADREKVWNVWKELGGSVVSYDVLGRRLCAFLSETHAVLTQAVTDRPGNIDLGQTPYA